MALKYRPQGKKFDAIAQEVRGEPAIGDDMDKFVLRLKPELYMRTYLNQRKTRLDGRDFHDWRNFEIICGAKRTALNSCVVGTACVSNGSTQVFASVELKSALESDPLLQFEVRPGCSGRDLTWARRVEILISEVYTAPDLAKALRLKVTLLSLSDGGALIDACFLAASAALTDSRIPPTTFDAERNLISVNPGSVHSLEFNLLPFSLTCAIFDTGNGRFVLTDPTSFEEDLCSLVTVVYGVSTSSGSTSSRSVLKLCQFPDGPSATTPALLRDCLRLTSRRICDFSGPVISSSSSPETKMMLLMLSCRRRCSVSSQYKWRYMAYLVSIQCCLP